jgi:hypothetical protein
MAPKPGKPRPHDEAILRKFIGIWCRKKHDRRDGSLCPECQCLLDYALRKLAHCPLNPKPKCKDCPV